MLSKWVSVCRYAASGGRAYRKRVEDIFKNARALVINRHRNIMAGASFLNNGQPSISSAEYDAVLSLIPSPTRVALTGSIAEVGAVQVESS